MSIIYKIKNFMRGRGGFDGICAVLSFLYIAVIIANIFVSSAVLTAIALVIFGCVIFRMFSPDSPRRRAENQQFSRFMRGLRGKIKMLGNKIRDAGTHRYRTCPHCRANLRLPRRRGKHAVVCPACGKRFEVRVTV